MKLNGWHWAWIVFSVLWIGGMNFLAQGHEYNGFVYFAIWSPPFFMLVIGYGIAVLRNGVPGDQKDED